MRFLRLLRWIVALPFLLLLVLFALSNRQIIHLGLFPTDFSLEVPLSVAILVALGLGFFLGGFRVWITALRHRFAARQARETIRVMEARQQETRRPPSGPLLAPPR